MLVKCAVCLHLVDDKDISVGRIIRQEYVDMVAINALSAANVAVGVVHFLLPLLAAGICTTTYRTFRVLDGHVIAINLDVSFLVVASLLLCISRVGFRSCLCCSNSGCKVVMLVDSVVLIKDVKNGTNHFLITATFLNETLLLSEL